MTSIGLTTEGPPETVLPHESQGVLDAVATLESLTDQEQREALVTLVTHHPRSLLSWATLGDHGRDTIEQYAAYRVGYHRGLDTLRANGWRGSGYVRWTYETNRPFLRCLSGLEKMASTIGETDEQQRCALFLVQLDPSWPPQA